MKILVCYFFIRPIVTKPIPLRSRIFAWPARMGQRGEVLGLQQAQGLVLHAAAGNGTTAIAWPTTSSTYAASTATTG